jgi:hypothetical protein
MPSRSASRIRLWPQPHDDVNFGDFVAVWRLDRPSELRHIGFDIADLTGVLEKEMGVIARVGVENRFVSFDRQAAHQADLRKDVEDIVHRSERRPRIGVAGLIGKSFGRQMPIAVSKKQLGEAAALPRRSQTVFFQERAAVELCGDPSPGERVFCPTIHDVSPLLRTWAQFALTLAAKES